MRTKRHGLKFAVGYRRPGWRADAWRALLCGILILLVVALPRPGLAQVVGPTITSQPVAQTNVAGATVCFSVVADGTPPLEYQWYLNGANLADSARVHGSGSSTVCVSDLQRADVGGYTVVVGNAAGSVTSSVATLTISSPLVTTQPQQRIMWIGGSTSLTVVASGTPPLNYQWRLNGTNVIGATNSSLVLSNVTGTQCGVYDVIVTNAYGSTVSTPAMLQISEVAVWGAQGELETKLTSGLTNIIAISGGDISFGDCVALRNDGRVIRWPGAYPPITNVIAVSAGNRSYYLGLKPDGTVVYWFFDTPLSSPPALSGFSNIVAIAPYQYGFLGLMADGTIVGSAATAGLANVVAISEGKSHSLALKADGSVLAWGSNAYGKTNIPSGVSNVVAIAAGSVHSLALKEDGTVMVWGGNSSSQTNVPASLSNVVAIAAGSAHCLALRRNGTVVAWGVNSSGETNVPAGLTNVIAIAAGFDFSLALIGTGPPVLNVPLMQPSYGTNGFSALAATQSGRVFALEYQDPLAGGNWTRLPLAAGTGGLQKFSDPAATNSSRFYRLRRW